MTTHRVALAKTLAAILFVVRLGDSSPAAHNDHFPENGFVTPFSDVALGRTGITGDSRTSPDAANRPDGG